MKVIINFSKRWLYTLIAIGILAIIVVGVYAINTNEGWHPASQIDFSGGITTPIITSDEICIGSDCKSSWPSGGGITEEVDPTVKSWAKTDNPSIPGTVSANVLKVSGSAVTVNSGCSESQWGEIRRCTYTNTYNRKSLCVCRSTYGNWKWREIHN